MYGGSNPTSDPKEQMPPKRIEGGLNPSPNISNSNLSESRFKESRNYFNATMVHSFITKPGVPSPIQLASTLYSIPSSAFSSLQFSRSCKISTHRYSCR